eukprot:CAMPEP_0196587764 /NCGR_PEP_ID=MMETSP1081-20130531/58534_1 /TAXON_ID=36882 /ORGANISM="Pyramimonas amylifera, Strain CCMP720" /LENGTH=296 /DNA_ID=CAMNT_0041910039 /DNA_START=339 /DNA_END=1229 /DNA_ORIENTATION=+
MSSPQLGICSFSGRTQSRFCGPNAARNSRKPSICMANMVASQAETQPKNGGGLGDFVAVVRAIAFYLTTVLIAVPLFHIMLLLSPVVLLVDKFKRNAMHLVNDVWANLTTLFFYQVEVKGRENLPNFDTAVVYVANHQSYLDIFSLFRLHRPFKFVSKSSIFLFPIVGWSMYLTGHVGLKRTDRRSQMACLQDCRKLLQEGASVLFFPEGTRSTSGKMDKFKKGAFSVAAKDQVPVVPITIVGTGKLMQNGREGLLRSGGVTLIVHPALKSKDANELCEKSEAMILNELEKYDYLV